MLAQIVRNGEIDVSANNLLFFVLKNVQNVV